MSTAPAVIYSPAYDMRLPGAGLLHPFDGLRASRAHAEIERGCTPGAVRRISPVAPISMHDLTRVHDADYLATLRDRRCIARIVESPTLRLLPSAFLARRIIDPMRWAAAGTVAAARHAMTHAAAINLGGGYHHAHRDHGEGFCAVADIPLAIALLRADGTIAADQRVLIIDLDAHRGNGHQAILTGDRSVAILDLYNAQAYPGREADRERWPWVIGLRAGMDGPGYLRVLTDALPAVLKHNAEAALVFYNAGTDVLAGDRLGGMALTPGDILARDRLVIETLERHRLPWVMTTSGGYSARSASVIAATACWAIHR